MPASYFRRVKKFPLESIRDDAHLWEAIAVVDALLRENLDDGGESYLDALTDLVETYEKKHVHIPDASESDVLRVLMAANGLTQEGLATEVGISQSTISAVLTGKRSLTKKQIVKLAGRFAVPPSVFLPDSTV